MSETITAEEFARLLKNPNFFPAMETAYKLGWKQDDGGCGWYNMFAIVQTLADAVALPADEPRTITGRLNGKPVALEVVYDENEPLPFDDPINGWKDEQ